MNKQPPWRNLDAHTREADAQGVYNEYVERGKDGDAIYGNQFHGQPLEHLNEELLDALCYTAVAARQLKDYKDILTLIYWTVPMPIGLYQQVERLLEEYD